MSWQTDAPEDTRTSLSTIQVRVVFAGLFGCLILGALLATEKVAPSRVLVACLLTAIPAIGLGFKRREFDRDVPLVLAGLAQVVLVVVIGGPVLLYAFPVEPILTALPEDFEMLGLQLATYSGLLLGVATRDALSWWKRG